MNHGSNDRASPTGLFPGRQRSPRGGPGWGAEALLDEEPAGDDGAAGDLDLTGGEVPAGHPLHGPRRHVHHEEAAEAVQEQQQRGVDLAPRTRRTLPEESSELTGISRQPDHRVTGGP